MRKVRVFIFDNVAKSVTPLFCCVDKKPYFVPEKIPNECELRDGKPLHRFNFGGLLGSGGEKLLITYVIEIVPWKVDLMGCPKAAGLNFPLDTFFPCSTSPPLRLGVDMNSSTVVT